MFLYGREHQVWCWWIQREQALWELLLLLGFFFKPEYVWLACWPVEKNAKNLFSILQYSDAVRLHNTFWKKKQVIGFIFSWMLVYIDKYIDVSCLEDINKNSLMLCFVGFSSFSQVKCAISGKRHTSISTVKFVSEVKSMMVVCHQGTTALKRHLLETTSSKNKYNFSNYCEMFWQ